MYKWLSRTCALALAHVLVLAHAGLLLGSQPIGAAQLLEPSPGLEKILQALASPSSLEFIETPLADVVDYLRDLHGIDIRMDLPAMQRAKLSPDCAITANVQGVSLRCALRVMLPSVGLTHVVEGDHVLITTRQAARGRLVANRYPIGALLDPAASDAARRSGGEALATAIAATVHPQTWWVAGGRGTIAALPPGKPKVLVATQIGLLQDEVAGLLGRMQRVADGGPGLDPAEQKIYKELAAPTSLEFVETPLQDVVDYLQDLHTINIRLDARNLPGGKIHADTPISATIKGIPLDAALQRVLDKVNLRWVIDGEVLVLTTAGEARRWWTVMVYPVEESVARRLALTASPPGPAAVMEKITATIAPKTWQQAGGSGVVVPLTLGKRQALVVRQTGDVHRQIVALLEPPEVQKPEPKPAKPAGK